MSYKVRPAGMGQLDEMNDANNKASEKSKTETIREEELSLEVFLSKCLRGFPKWSIANEAVDLKKKRRQEQSLASQASS
jgi:hypothetical protein